MVLKQTVHKANLITCIYKDQLLRMNAGAFPYYNKYRGGFTLEQTMAVFACHPNFIVSEQTHGRFRTQPAGEGSFWTKLNILNDFLCISQSQQNKYFLQHMQKWLAVVVVIRKLFIIVIIYY